MVIQPVSNHPSLLLVSKLPDKCLYAYLPDGSDNHPAAFKKTRRFTPYKKTLLRENTTTIVFLSREALAFE